MHAKKLILKIVSTIIDVRLVAWHNKLKQLKAIKKDISKELMPAAWHPTRWWDWCMPEDEKKGIKLIFIDKVGR